MKVFLVDVGILSVGVMIGIIAYGFIFGNDDGEHRK